MPIAAKGEGEAWRDWPPRRRPGPKVRGQGDIGERVLEALAAKQLLDGADLQLRVKMWKRLGRLTRSQAIPDAILDLIERQERDGGGGPACSSVKTAAKRAARITARPPYGRFRRG